MQRVLPIRAHQRFEEDCFKQAFLWPALHQHGAAVPPRLPGENYSKRPHRKNWALQSKGDAIGLHFRGEEKASRWPQNHGCTNQRFFLEWNPFSRRKRFFLADEMLASGAFSCSLRVFLMVTHWKFLFVQFSTEDFNHVPPLVFPLPSLSRGEHPLEAESTSPNLV